MPEKTLKICALSLLSIFLILFFFRPIETEDVWWHLSTGRWIASHQDVPRYDVFNSTDEKIPWFPTHWLGSYTLYLIFGSGGLFGLKIFRMAFFLFILGIFIYKTRKNLPIPFLIAFTLIFAFGLDSRALLRPFIFNFLFTLIYLNILFHHLDNDKSKLIFLIPLLSAMWFNIHLCVFVYGTMVLGIFLFCSILNLMTSIPSQKVADGAFRLWRRKTVELTAVTAGHFAAFLINPFGVEGALYPYRLTLAPGSDTQRFFLDTIMELAPPGQILSWAGSWFWLLVISVALAFRFNKNARLTELLLFLISLFSLIYSARFIDLFLCACMAVLWQSFPALTRTHPWERWPYSKRLHTAAYLFLITFLAIHIYMLANRTVYMDKQLKREMSLDLSPYNPFEALALLRKLNIQGTVFAWDGYGGAILWSQYPQIKPLADSRQINMKTFLDYVRTIRSPEKYWETMRSKYGFNAAILDANFGTLGKTVDHLVRHPEWKVVFLKGSCIVFMKKDAYPLPAEWEGFQDGLSRTSPRLDELKRVLDKQAARTFSFIDAWRDPLIVYSQPMEEGVALYTAGYKAAGLNRLLDAYKAAPHDEKLNNILRLVSNDYLNPH